MTAHPEMGLIIEQNDYIILITQADLDKKEGTFKYFKNYEELEAFCYGWEGR